MAIREQENPAESVSGKRAQLAAGPKPRAASVSPTGVMVCWYLTKLLGQTRLGEDLRIRHGQEFLDHYGGTQDFLYKRLFSIYRRSCWTFSMMSRARVTPVASENSIHLTRGHRRIRP
jgi:hypothetical protein